MKKTLCMRLNCKEKSDLSVTVKVNGGGSVVTRLCLKHIRSALSRESADFVLWNCVPGKEEK